MQRTFINWIKLILIGILMYGFTPQIHVQNQPELVVRGGLPFFINKALKGDTLKVAYLGGSITEQPGWRVYSLDWLRKQFPQSTFIEINAAIGGTGSDFGVFRLEKHVLKFKPDLIFIEFAVNDDGKNQDIIERSVEGIIRHCKSFNPEMDICLIYTIKNDFLNFMMNGKMPQSILSMEKIASHYKIPSINFGIEVTRLLKQDKLIMMAGETEKDGKMVFSPDGVHPFPDTGHRIYQQVFARCFMQIMGKNQSKTTKYLLPSSVRNDFFDNALSLDFDELPIQNEWQKIITAEHPDFKQVNRLIKSTMLSTIPDASVNFSFKGTAVGVCDLMGPGAGRVIVKIDGISMDTVFRFDKYSTYWRANYFLIHNLKDTVHFVSFVQYEEPFDKTAILGPNQKIIIDETRYSYYKWYPCEILINGKICNK